MRSPTPRPGRNTIFENMWRWISSWSNTPIQGSQRNGINGYFNDDSTRQGRYYDLEIKEQVVRGDDNETRARDLIYIKHRCGLVGLAIDILSDCVMSSADGDDQYFCIGNTLNDNITLVNPQIKKILDDLIVVLISRGVLDQIPRNFLMYGDAFMSLGVSDDAKIDNFLVLPTWEMFRVENNQGQLLGFEQRSNLADFKPIQFHPSICIHWRYRRETLYGRSLFQECIDDALELIEAKELLSGAAKITATNPRVHEFSCDATAEEVEEYKREYQNRKLRGPIYDYFIPQGQNIRPFSNTPPNIDALLKYKKDLVQDIGSKSRIPPWLIGLETVGAREIAGEPSKFFALYINRIRTVFASGLRQLFNAQLMLSGIPKEDWQYRIVFPKFYINPVLLTANPESEEMNSSTVEDLDSRRIPEQIIDCGSDSELEV